MVAFCKCRLNAFARKRFSYAPPWQWRSPYCIIFDSFFTTFWWLLFKPANQIAGTVKGGELNWQNINVELDNTVIDQKRKPAESCHKRYQKKQLWKVNENNLVKRQPLSDVYCSCDHNLTKTLHHKNTGTSAYEAFDSSYQTFKSLDVFLLQISTRLSVLHSDSETWRILSCY